MIEITIKELDPYVNKIRQIYQQLTEILLQMKNNMVMIDNYWIGNTSKTFIEKVSLLDDKIVYYQDFVERYASHLEMIIEQYRLTETNLQQNAAAF